MRHNASKLAVLALMVLVASGLCAWADTLELRDGRVIRGKFLGGTESTVRMEIDGHEQSFAVSQVMALSFSDAPAASLVPVAPVSVDPQYMAPQTTPPAKVTIPAGTRILVRMIGS